MNDLLPSQLLEGALLRDKEFAWALEFFPTALNRAPTYGYACLGGQIWFSLEDDSLYEAYWLEAEATERVEDEPLA